MATVSSTTTPQAQAEKDNQMQYTMFVSGLNHGRMSDFTAKREPDDVAILFDVVNTTAYTKTFQKSQYPLESKSAASDHVQEQDGKFSFTAMMSDVAVNIYDQNYLDVDTDRDNPMQSKRATKAMTILEKVAKEKNMVTLVTEDNILTGYVITSLTSTRSGDGGATLTFQIDMEEFRRRDIGRTVLASTPSIKAGKKNGGAKQTAAGGTADNDANGKRNPSPYISPKKDSYRAIDKAVTGKTYDIDDAPGGTIRPDGKFDPGSLRKP